MAATQLQNHKAANGILLSGMARYAALYCRKIGSRPTAFRKHSRPAAPTIFARSIGLGGPDVSRREIKRSVASHSGEKHPDCRAV